MLAAAALFFLAGAFSVGHWRSGSPPSVSHFTWHVLCVGAVLLALASIAFIAGRTDVSEDLTPTRAIHHLKEDIRTTKEQLS